MQTKYGEKGRGLFCQMNRKDPSVAGKNGGSSRSWVEKTTKERKKKGKCGSSE